MLLQLLLHNMQGSIWKLIGQNDYPQLQYLQSLKHRKCAYVMLATDLLK